MFFANPKKPSEAHWILGRRIKGLIDAGASDFDACAKLCAQLQLAGESLTFDDVTMIGRVLDQIIIKPDVEGYWYNILAGNCDPILVRIALTEDQSWISKYWYLFPAGIIGMAIIRKAVRK